MTDCNKDDGRGSMVSGIIILGVGLYFLAWNMDIIPDPEDSWPIFLIIVGIALMIGNIFKKNKNKPTDDPNQQQLYTPKEPTLEQQEFQRTTVYPPSGTGGNQTDMTLFKLQTGNTDFQLSRWTFVSMSILLVFYPVISLLGLEEDPGAILRSLNQGSLIFLLVATILFQWTIFLFNYVTLYFEGTGLAGVGLGRIRLLDFAWAGAFFLAAWTILTGLAWFLAQVGLPMPGEIGLLVPTTAFGKVIWVLVSFTAGFCEEIAYRGYLMTRLRLLGKFKTWVAPVVISSLMFGIGHAYQGVPGLIVITAYGVLFSLLYIRTGRLWPCIIAHSFQDLGALFLPQ